ncbi:hypothetical protein BDV93DRAFT_102046 [Ceratobasidium sp. AG-I]|nr:hypothetical protein BDV93DRAFT_102046 [Ceratobasidium sp. AG-I]
MPQDFILDRVEELAKYLVSFRPNLKRVAHYSYSPSQAKVPSLNMLNFCIRTFRGLAETRQRIAQQHGEEAVKSLISPQLNAL